METKYPGPLQVGETFETEAWRVHRYSTSVCVTRIDNAGKRGKKCESFSVYGYNDENDVGPVAHRLACLSVDGIGVDEMRVEIEIAAGRDLRVETRTFRGVDVAPAKMPEIRIQGQHVLVLADPLTWSVLDTDDHYNEPTLLPLKAKDAKAMYAWAKKNEARLATMKFNQVMTALREDGIGYHYYCAVD